MIKINRFYVFFWLTFYYRGAGFVLAIIGFEKYEVKL